mgnify:CR=1 FL=1|jgi:hypothetical protein
MFCHYLENITGKYKDKLHLHDEFAHVDESQQLDHYSKTRCQQALDREPFLNSFHEGENKTLDKKVPFQKAGDLLIFYVNSTFPRLQRLLDCISIHRFSNEQLTCQSFMGEDNEGLCIISKSSSFTSFLEVRQATDAEAVRIVECKNRYCLEKVAAKTLANLLPGVTEILIDLVSMGLQRVIASPARRGNS